MAPLFEDDMRLPEAKTPAGGAHTPRRRRAIVLSVVAGALLLGVLFVLVGTGRDAPSYRTVHLRRQDVAATVVSSGTLNPVVTVAVGTPVSGIIKSLHADFNTRVKKGQIIAQIDPATYGAQVMQTHGGYVNAQAALKKARATSADADRTLSRYAKLLGDGSIAQADYDTAATAAKTARDAVSEAEGSLEQTRGAWIQARTNLAYTAIRSPLDGIVISRNVDVGQTVAASFQTPTLFTIAQDLTKMQILASVDEADIGKIRVGSVAAFTVDAYPERRFSGVVAQMRNSATTVSNVVTYSVVIAVRNADLALKPGMTANVTFTSARKTDVLAIPTAALRFKPRAADAGTQGAPLRTGEKRVYVLRRGVAVPAGVRIGIANDRNAEVLSGLSPADAVIVEQQAGGGGKAGLVQNIARPHF